MNIGIQETITMADGQEIIIETGKLAKQAHGSVVVKQGKTMLLATVVSNEEAKEGIDFLPLTVEYREKYASTGKFPGGFIKREARPADSEILTARLIDRALRPLFPSDYHSDTQVMISLVSSDKDTQPDSLACLAASAAIAVSDLPFAGPVSEVRVARINGEWRVNPKLSEMADADIDIMLAATLHNIMMLEGEMKEVSEADMVEAIQIGHEAIKNQVGVQMTLASRVKGAGVKREYSHEEHDEELYEQVKAATFDKSYEVAKQQIANKKGRKEAFKAVLEEYTSTLSEEVLEEKGHLIKTYFYKVEKAAVRKMMIEDKMRLDGRKLNEIRPIWGEVGYLPGPHGSSIFTRGETQSLTTVTLGNKMNEQSIDGAFHEGSEKFLLHYNFPPFSTGEARPIRSTSRREIGHGNLALRALKQVVPSDESNPYTVRVVSDILESNGSSSMATVCAGSMAMMDAGVKIKKPVSGIAMGLAMDPETKNYSVLSDILGDEDHLGDMDFKVTGTADGITACQMDIKVDGLSADILKEALEQAREGRLHILEEMNKVISEPREDYKDHAPRIVQIFIPKDMIGAVIGPGGKIIQEIQKETNTTISIDEDDRNGIVDIMSDDKASIDGALARIRAITAVPEAGEVYKGKVKNIMPFGAFIEILPGRDGLLHISEIDWRRLESVEEVLKEGDEVEVKLIEIDEKSGKLRLSRKALLPRPERKPQGDRDRRPHGNRPPREPRNSDGEQNS
ncbi:MAG: polyribonucleotide nucleotidyltransferase [Salibacteraceae bacterium]